MPPSRSASVPPSAWPPLGYDQRAWSQAARAGSRADRELRTVRVSIPRLVAGRSISLSSLLTTQVEDAMREVTALDHASGPELRALGALLLRTESVASSKIEQVEATIEDYARAMHGGRSNASASSMVAAIRAFDAMMARVTETRSVDLQLLNDAQRALMIGDPSEASYAGRLRDVQNWIGGSDYSPRDALYVPPPPDLVDALMVDLVAFANRTDLPSLPQAAIAHAQFESIHPYTDGNGRIGRALINAMLRARGATRYVVVPLASAFVAHRDRYFDLLGEYRRGDIEPLIESFATATLLAAQESRATAARLAELPGEWRTTLGRVRSPSATASLLELLLTNPIMTADEAASLVSAPTSSIYSAIERLHGAGILRPLTSRKRDQVWGAADVLDELDDLGARIARAAT